MSEPEPEQPAPEWESVLKPVTVDTPLFKAEALALYDMPSARVMDAMLTPDPDKMIKMFSLFRLALINPERVDDLTMLSFDELNQLVMEWVDVSNEKQAERTYAREHGLDLDKLSAYDNLEQGQDGTHE